VRGRSIINTSNPHTPQRPHVRKWQLEHEIVKHRFGGFTCRITSQRMSAQWKLEVSPTPLPTLAVNNDHVSNRRLGFRSSDGIPYRHIFPGEPRVPSQGIQRSIGRECLVRQPIPIVHASR